MAMFSVTNLVDINTVPIENVIHNHTCDVTETPTGGDQSPFLELLFSGQDPKVLRFRDITFDTTWLSGAPMSLSI